MTQNHNTHPTMKQLSKLIMTMFVALSTLGCEEMDHNNTTSKIYYTTTDGNKLFPYIYEPYTFGAILLSNEYQNGAGVMEFDNTLTIIGGLAFADCETLSSISIPNSVTVIDSGAFLYCSTLQAIDIPDSVTTIGNGAFNECKSMAHLALGSGITHIGVRAFYGCSNIETVTIPNNTTDIESHAFDNCKSLTTLTLGDNVANIGEWAFCNCSNISTVTLPESVTSIGDGAFAYCTNLAKIYCKATTPPTAGKHMFAYTLPSHRIYVPTESLKAYKTAEGWSDYAIYIKAYDFEE